MIGLIPASIKKLTQVVRRGQSTVSANCRQVTGYRIPVAILI